MKNLFGLVALTVGSLACVNLYAQVDSPEDTQPPFGAMPPGSPMTLHRLETIIEALDPDAERIENAFALTVATPALGPISVNVFTDPVADRMRIVVGVAEEETLSPELIRRVMQANFDSALDARYAISQEILWSTYIHPLSPLTDEEFLSGLSQTVTLLLTFGTTFTSGVFIYGGGDSGELLEELEKLLQPQA